MYTKPKRRVLMRNKEQQFSAAKTKPYYHHFPVPFVLANYDLLAQSKRTFNNLGVHFVRPFAMCLSSLEHLII